MGRSVKPALLVIFYILNFAILTCLLSAAFFLAQGLFGDLYACNEKATGEIQYVYDTSSWVTADYCMVDLNYTANKDTRNEQSFYALQVALKCDRLYLSPDSNTTVTTLCYNHYHPEFFSSATDPEIMDSVTSHNEAIGYLHMGFKSALWMALFAFISSAVNRHMDRIDCCIMQIQDHSCNAWHQFRNRCSEWRQRRRGDHPQDVAQEQELEQITVQPQPSSDQAAESSNESQNCPNND